MRLYAAIVNKNNIVYMDIGNPMNFPCFISHARPEVE